MYSTSRPIPNLIGDIVDTIRATGVITNVTIAGVNSIVESINMLILNEYITINDIDYSIISANGKQFTILGDVTGQTAWKALAPYYEKGHMLEIAQILGEKKGVKANYKKYPLIALKLDLPEDRKSIAEIKVNPTFYLIQDTESEYYASQRLEKVFIPVLDPLHEKFIDALANSSLLNNDGHIEHNSDRHYYWGKKLPQYNEAIEMNDRLDAIEITDIELLFATTNCG